MWSQHLLAFGVVAQLVSPALADPALNPEVSQATINDTICAPGYSYTVRPSYWQSARIKLAMLRSLKDLLLILEKIDKSGAGFRSVTEHVDTTTSAGRMMMQMLGSFAEFERSMIRERTRAGLAAAKEDGRVGGRPRSLNDKQRREIADAVLSGRKTAADMARLFGVSPATISRVLAGMLSPPG